MPRPSPSRSTTAGPESLPDLDDDRFWQVIDRDSGAVVAASDAAEGFGALADRDGERAGARRCSTPSEPPFVTAVEREGGDWIVVVGRSTEEVDATLATVGVLLAVSVPLVAGVVALTTWFAVGRVARPGRAHAAAGRADVGIRSVAPRRRARRRATRSAASPTR